jgi:phosphatidylinositol-3-phosphatase
VLLASRALMIVAAAGCAACGSALPAASLSSPASASAAASPAASTGLAASTSPVTAAPAHTVVVVMENHSYGQVIGNPQAPFINRLAGTGALLTDSRAITHPSQPNYLALFSGSSQGVIDDSCPHRFSSGNLAAELISAGRTFAGYSEDLPAPGSGVCASGGYARKHVPWINFTNVPAAASLPFSRFPAGQYARLPTVSFVIPNLCHDMHDCSVATGDAWLQAHLAGYAAWARQHHSLLIVTWDENDDSPGNRIATIFAGQMVRHGRFGQPVTHYNVLATLESVYRLPQLGHARTAALISGIWIP